MKFKKWITDQGGTVAVGKLLGITSAGVRRWLSGHTTPSALLMQKIVKLSGGRVTYDDIINETKRKKIKKC